MSKVGYSTKASESLLAMFKEYRAVNQRATPELVKKQTTELADYLFKATPRASAPEIKAKLESLGARFIRAPAGYARKVGQSASAKSLSPREREIRKGRQKQGKDLRGRFDKMDVKLTLTEQRYAAYNFRIGHIGAMASSWIPAMRQLGSKMRVSDVKEKNANKRPMSRIVAHWDENKSSIDIVNRQEGMAALAAKTGFVDKAMDMTAANMKTYIDRKRGEMKTIFSKAAMKAK